MNAPRRPGRRVDPHLAADAGAHHLAPGVLLLRADALAEVAALVSRGVHHARAHGTRLTAPTIAVVDVLLATSGQAVAQRAVASPAGRGDVPDRDGQAGCAQVVEESLTTVEAARLLGISPRQVRRLDTVWGSRVGGRLVLDRAAVEAEAARRASARATRPERTA